MSKESALADDRDRIETVSRKRLKTISASSCWRMESEEDDDFQYITEKYCVEKSVARKLVGSTSASKLKNNSASKLAKNNSDSKAAQNNSDSKLVKNDSDRKSAENSSYSKLVENTSASKLAQNNSDSKVVKNNSSSGSVKNNLASEFVKNTSAHELVGNTLAPINTVAKTDLQWMPIVKQDLNLNYVTLFSKSIANEFLERLEKEVEYFEGDLLKIKIFGKSYQIPRKQVSFGDPGLSYKFSGTCIPALTWTPLILELKKCVEDVLHEEFNFVLVNRYKDGDDYIGEHRDDEKDLEANAPIASLSFGQERDFIFRHKDARKPQGAKNKIDPVKIVLEHGSLLVMYFPTNKFWYHSLPKRKNVSRVRVNLTFRKIRNKK